MDWHGRHGATDFACLVFVPKRLEIGAIVLVIAIRRLHFGAFPFGPRRCQLFWGLSVAKKSIECRFRFHQVRRKVERISMIRS